MLAEEETTLLMFMLALACSSGGKDSAADSGTPTNTTPATLSGIQADIFTNSCGFSSCHGQGGNAANLVLDEGESYANLVNAPSTDDPSVMRVAPGDPAASVLMIRLESDDMTYVMPPSQPLSAAKIEAVRSWIEAGALDN